MEDGSRTLHSGRLNPPLERTTEEWEDWEDDDEPLTPLNASSGDGHLLSRGSGPGRPSPSPRRTAFASRLSVERPVRPRSRQRQKAQNAKAGISLITDMSKFRPQQLKNENRVSRTGRFVDAAALSALEGTSAAQESTFAWFRKKGQSSKVKTPDRLEVEPPRREDLSPSGGPIMIGFAMPSDSNVVISPQTAVVESPDDFGRYFVGEPATAVSTTAPASAWSPDSDDLRASQRVTGAEGLGNGRVPAVPSVPKAYRNTGATTVILTDDEGESPRKAKSSKRDTRVTSVFLSDDEDDTSTPVTLFEEDGSPGGTVRRSLKQKGRQRSGTTTSSRSQGWWDQVITPFTRTPTTPQGADTKESGGWWKDADKKTATPTSPKYKFTFPPVKAALPTKKTAPTKDRVVSPVVKVTPPAPEPAIQEYKAKVSEKRVDVDIADQSCTVEASHRPPRIVVQAASPPLSSSPESMAAPPRARVRPAKNATVEGEDDHDHKQATELPPPYSPPSQKHNVRYQVVLPPGHPRNNQMGNPYYNMYPPSPGPVSPGLSRTMTSQGAIGLRNVPSNPQLVDTSEPRSAYMPDRPLGSYRPADNLPSVGSDGMRQKAERKRRRYEQEDAVAYRAGRAWGGRGCCIPLTACFGRPGREGRKRRRICLCIGVMIIILIVLAIALPLTVFRSKRGTDSTPPSQFLNLTNFPPMPTGINTVAGTESIATGGCVTPPTLWSCSLPKEQASDAAPYDPSQPSFILQIQFDNSTRQLWNTPEPTLTARNGPVGIASYLQQLVRRQANSINPGFRPNPPPPNLREIFFLGNSTDGVVSPSKAGEPTPFYISILRSADDARGPTVLNRRQSSGTPTNSTPPPFASFLPPPVLAPDGTAAPAVLLPFPEQQPLRLYDRGLPTERYAFYTYFDKSTFLKSVVPLDRNSPSPVPADLNGGALKTEANFIITWLQTRYKVEIWTRRDNLARLLTDSSRDAGNTTRPGSFPYPVTITLDTHGGQPQKKFAFVRGVDERQRVAERDPKFVINDMATRGDLVNGQGSRGFDSTLGGMDGGTGGCKCEFVNWVGVNGGR